MCMFKKSVYKLKQFSKAWFGQFTKLYSFWLSSKQFKLHIILEEILRGENVANKVVAKKYKSIKSKNDIQATKSTFISKLCLPKESITPLAFIGACMKVTDYRDLHKEEISLNTFWSLKPPPPPPPPPRGATKQYSLN